MDSHHLKKIWITDQIHSSLLLHCIAWTFRYIATPGKTAEEACIIVHFLLPRQWMVEIIFFKFKKNSPKIQFWPKMKKKCDVAQLQYIIHLHLKFERNRRSSFRDLLCTKIVHRRTDGRTHLKNYIPPGGISSPHVG